MSRFEEFITEDRIDEKVSKQEIEEALKNDNILVGCEFEFKVDDGRLASGYKGYNEEITELYNNASDEIERYNNDVRYFEREQELYFEETDDLKRKLDKIQDKIDTLQDAIDRAVDDEIPAHKEQIEDYENEIGLHQDDIDNTKEDLKNASDNSEIVKLKKTIAYHEGQIKSLKGFIKQTTSKIEKADNLNNEWEHEIDTLEKKKSDLEDDIKYREEAGYIEEVEIPYLSKHNAPNYYEYMKEYHGYSERDLYVEPAEYADLPPEWELSGIDDFESAVEDSNILDSAPFNDYRIGSYKSVTQNVGSTVWAVEEDSSLGEDGVEVKNPPMKITKFIGKNVLKDMFNWINDIGYTDNDCGFHCHMSLVNPKGEIDYTKLILFTDEQWIYNSFEERAYSYYARSVKDKMKTSSTLDPKDVRQIFNTKKFKIKLNMPSQHFDAINLIDEKTGHVEFRYMGGSNYHKKYNDVVATIGVYAYNLSLAADPDFKKKEYRLKLERIFNKMELYVLYHKKEALDLINIALQRNSLRYTDKDKMLYQKDIKEVRGLYRILASIYKLDNETQRAIDSNTNFKRGVGNEIMSMVNRYSEKMQNDINNMWSGI